MVSSAKNACIEYAKNRIELKALNDKINTLIYDHNHNINLAGFRECWYDTDDSGWVSWVYAIEYSGMDVKPEQLELAKMLDKKKAIKKDGGYLRTKLYAIGKSLITES